MSAYRSACPTMGGRADIYVGFYEVGLRSLRPGGRLGFICADRWMRNQYGRRLRELVTRGYSVDLVLSMHDVDAFHEQVSAYPAITIIRNACRRQRQQIRPADCSRLTSFRLIELYNIDLVGRYDLPHLQAFHRYLSPMCIRGPVRSGLSPSARVAWSAPAAHRLVRFIEAVDTVRDRFGLSQPAMVGDRGMITSARIEALRALSGTGWLTALRVPAIAKLAADDGPPCN